MEQLALSGSEEEDAEGLWDLDGVNVRDLVQVADSMMRESG